MQNEFRGVKTTEHYCKVGNVTRIKVETKVCNEDENFNEPIKDID
jgi:hypothetical protein